MVNIFVKKSSDCNLVKLGINVLTMNLYSGRAHKQRRDSGKKDKLLIFYCNGSSFHSAHIEIFFVLFSELYSPPSCFYSGLNSTWPNMAVYTTGQFLLKGSLSTENKPHHTEKLMSSGRGYENLSKIRKSQTNQTRLWVGWHNFCPRNSVLWNLFQKR